jgi:hypothetical protein
VNPENILHVTGNEMQHRGETFIIVWSDSIVKTNTSKLVYV